MRLEWVDVPAGEYLIGEERDARTVRLGAFRLGRHPVTNAQYAEFAAATGTALEPELARRLQDAWLAGHPVTGVSLAAAEAFCAWLAAECGAPVRLPGGDEWEAAGRGGTATAWPWGDAFDPDACNSVEAGVGYTVPVDARPAGASWCGAEQLSGNVWEWTADADGSGWRFVRGGCFLDFEWGVRATRRLPADPRRATTTTGFRLALGEAPEDRPARRTR